MELILNTYGIALNRDNEGFVISNKDGQQRIPINGITSITICKGAQVTSDAILLAIENEIEVIFSSMDGSPAGRVWSPKYGSISTIRRGQLNFSYSKDSVDWIKQIIIKKIENQQGIILIMNSSNAIDSKITNKAINRLEDYRTKIKNLSGEIVSDIAATLRGWEGVSSKIYFEVLNNFIPDNLRFEQRSQYPALDPVNAMLNYGYGVLYRKIEGALIKAGIDPYIGVLHRDNYNRPVLVYDIIELYRVWIDYIVYRLASQNIITDELYSTKEDGSCWLEPLGRRIMIQSINDYLDEVIEYNNMNRSRITQIQLYTQNLAQKFKKYQ